MLDAKKTDTVVPAKAGTQRLILTVPEFPEEPGVSLRRYDDAQGAIDWRKRRSSANGARKKIDGNFPCGGPKACLRARHTYKTRKIEHFKRHVYKYPQFLYMSPRVPMRSLHDLNPGRFETAPILKALNQASRNLAELKGVAASIPNQGILINTLTLQEARDSSAIENIVTTQDDLYREEEPAETTGTAIKEVLRYRQALRAGFDRVQDSGLLTLNTILDIQQRLECNLAGFRKLPGTALRDGAGAVVYEPPQDANDVLRLMGDLEKFIHDQPPFDADPLVRMALIHHQFESIHPFYDGNGRTGRIINVLYLVKEGLLDIPVLYLSRHIVQTKPDYYRLLQAVRDHDDWEGWVLYMLQAIASTAAQTVATIQAIKTLLQQTKLRIREHYRFYSQDLINNLFNHPYTRVEFLQRELGVSRLTATRYLDKLAEDGVLRKMRMGRNNYYVNQPLFDLLARAETGLPR
jgi:Fic family protein